MQRLPVRIPGVWCWGPRLRWGSTRLWFLQPGSQRLCPLCTEFSNRDRNHAKVICNVLSNSKGNSSIWRLAQWADSAGQLLGTGTGTCSLTVPQHQVFIHCIVLATMSNQMLIMYYVHGKWGRLSPRPNIPSCHLGFLSFFFPEPALSDFFFLHQLCSQWPYFLHLICSATASLLFLIQMLGSKCSFKVSKP